VLTAGLGTRLMPLSQLLAKPALPVAGVPLAGRILRWLADSGVTSAVLNLHHKPETITGVVGDGTPFGISVRYSWERIILGSAGGPALALTLLDAARVFIVNGDTLTDVNLSALAAAHRNSGARVTLALVPNPDPEHYGGVRVDEAGCVTGFTRRGPDNVGLHFIGVQAVDADVFAPLDPTVPAESIGGVYRELMAQRPGSVRAFVSRASFRDIGTPADYLDTSLEIGRLEGRGDGLRGARTTIGERTCLSRCILWDDVRVGSDVTLDRCVVTSGSAVPDGTRCTGAILRPFDNEALGAGELRLGALIVTPIAWRHRARG
jgi:mannose-1-phosphate guanylyltransferase